MRKTRKKLKNLTALDAAMPGVKTNPRKNPTRKGTIPKGQNIGWVA